MTRNHLHCTAPVFLMLLGPWCGVLAAPCPSEEECGCLQCPAGQEPSTVCSEVVTPDPLVECRSCPAGSFSDLYGPDQCRAHTVCRNLNRRLVVAGTSESDAVCGSCLAGFQPSDTPTSSTLTSCVRRSWLRLRRNTGKGNRSGGAGADGAAAGGTNSTAVKAAEEKHTEYAVFALVPVFCVMGLLGILICNLLKKKGYHCTGDKENAEGRGGALQKEGNTYGEDGETEDTISALVRLITEKKENAAALEELFLEYEKKQPSVSKAPSFRFPGLPNFRSLPRLCTHHHHPHTINGLAPLTGLGCSRCSQKKWPELLTPLTLDTQKTSFTPSVPSSPAVGTVHNIGRFQVAQIPEGDTISVVTTPAESSDTDSLYSTNTEPAEEASLLGASSISYSASSRSKQNMNA